MLHSVAACFTLRMDHGFVCLTRHGFLPTVVRSRSMLTSGLQDMVMLDVVAAILLRFQHLTLMSFSIRDRSISQL